jgi:diketogulonate reductase-like aldo/keto reductase
VADAARRHGRTPAQIVLRWQVQQEGVAAIPRSSDAGRIAQNLQVFDFALEGAEMAQDTEPPHLRLRILARLG